MNKKILLFLITGLQLVVGCVSLKEVNEYAVTSAASLDKISDAHYTFTDYCQHDCELQQMRLGTIDTSFKCNCQALPAKADEVVQKIHSTITSYLVAIHQLSDNKGFSYNVANLTSSLQANPLLHISDEQVGVYTKAGNFITTAATTFYRKKKLQEYLVQADPIFQDLTFYFSY